MNKTPPDIAQEWHNIRFFGRLFEEAVYLRSESVRFSERAGHADAELIAAGRPIKSMQLKAGEPARLQSWLVGRQDGAPGDEIKHGAPGGYFRAHVTGGDKAAVFQLSNPALADIVGDAAAIGLDQMAVRGIEGVLEKYPGFVALVGVDSKKLQITLRALARMFGWIDCGVACAESAKALVTAMTKFPMLMGVQAGSPAQALSVFKDLGFPVTDLPLRGFLLQESEGVAWQLPIFRNIGAPKPLPQTKQKAAPAKPTGKTPAPVLLVVEDDLDQQEILKLMLTTDGFDVLTAPNGVDALEILRDQRVSGVITDLMMPILDGKQLVQGIRRDPKLKSLPVLILTVIDDPAREMELLRAGANDYCVKTAQPKVLLQRIRKVVGL